MADFERKSAISAPPTPAPAPLSRRDPGGTVLLNVDSRKPTIEPTTWPTLSPPFTNGEPMMQGAVSWIGLLLVTATIMVGPWGAMVLLMIRQVIPAVVVAVMVTVVVGAFVLRTTGWKSACCAGTACFLMLGLPTGVVAF